MSDDITNVRVTLERIHVIDDNDWVGRGELFFEGNVDGIPIVRSEIFRRNSGEDITLSGADWQKVVNVSSRTSFDLTLSGTDDDTVRDDSLGTATATVRQNDAGEWPDGTLSAPARNPEDFVLYYRVEPILALNPAVPETAVVCRQNAGNPSCSTISGVSVRVLRITATVPSTPPHTARAAPAAVANAWAAPADLSFTSTQRLPGGPLVTNAADFNTPNALVLVRRSTGAPQGPVRLVADTEPAGADVYFEVVRASDDGATVGGATDLPTLTNTGNNTATLQADARGSFYVFAYIDADRNHQRANDEPGIKLPLIIVDCTVPNDRSTANPANYRHNFDGVAGRVNSAAYNWVQIEGGEWSSGAAGAGISFDADVLAIGGGPNGRRGVDRVFVGWANTIQRMTREATYSDGSVLRMIIADNVPGGVGSQGSFTAAAPVPSLIAPFWLDTGRFLNAGQTAASHSRHGGSNILFSRSQTAADVNQTLGVHKTVTAIDSPRTAFDHNHPNNTAHASGRLRQINEHLAMFTRLVAWTNTTGGNGQPSPGTANAVGFRTFTVLAEVPWVQSGQWNVTHSGGNFRLRPATGANAPSLNDTFDGVTNDPIPRAGNAELRPPSALEFYGTDAR